MGINIGFNLTTQIQVKTYKIYDLFAFKTASNSKFLGFWLNSNLNKLSIVKVINPREENLKFIELNIIKINLEDTSSEILLKKIFPHINTYQEFNFSYSDKYSSFFIFDNTEIYNFSLVDKEEKILDDLKNQKNSLVSYFDLIYNNFNKYDFSQRTYIVFKLLKNFEKFGIIIENITENKQLIYMIHSIIDSVDNKIKKNDFYDNYFNGNSYLPTLENEDDIKNTCNYNNLNFQGNMNNNIPNMQNNLDNLFNVDNLIHIFYIFLRNKKLYYIYNILRKFLKNYFELLAKSEKINNNTEIFILVNINKTNLNPNNLFINNKKIYEIIEKIIVYSIVNKFKQERKGSVEYSQINSKTLQEDVSNNTSNKRKVSEDNFLVNKNLEILKDLLKFNFSLKNRHISIRTINFFNKIFFCKIKILKEKNTQIPLLNELDGEIELFNFDIEDFYIENSEEKKNILNLYGDLLSFEMLSKIFVKLEDYKKAVKCLVYDNNFKEIFELIKNKIIPFKSIQPEFENLLEFFNTDQILLLMEMLEEQKDPNNNDNVNVQDTEKNENLQNFLKMILEINKKKINSKFSEKNNNIKLSNKIINIFELINIILSKNKINSLLSKRNAEDYLFYLLDFIIKKIKFQENVKNSSEENQENLNKLEENYGENILTIKNFILEYKNFDFKKILLEFKNNLYTINILNIILITIYDILKEFKSIIDIQIEINKDPEISINFIENLDVPHSNKEQMFEYLKVKIIKSNFLTPIKKFYFINLFEDTEEVFFNFFTIFF